jgi:colanic acid/amylovoran biosynthesis glycosyltransferase
MLAVDVCASLDVPVLVHFHGYDVSGLVADPIYVRSLRQLFRKMALGITVSEGMRQQLLELGCPSDRVFCHYTGVPEEYFTKASRLPPEQRFVLLQVGRLAEIKGHRFALAAVAKVRRVLPALTFRIIGDGELRGAIQRYVEELGITGNVELLGWEEPAAVIREMQSAHALIVPSSTTTNGAVEGLPNVAVEAMASGLPVIGTYHGGIPEAFRYSEADWLAPEADVEALAKRIERLAGDVQLWTRVSEEGQRVAQQHFHLPTQNRKLEALYRKLIRRRAYSREQGDSWSLQSG